MKSFEYIAHKILIRDIKLKENINPHNIHDFNAKTYTAHVFKDQSEQAHINFMKVIFVISDKSNSNSKLNQFQSKYIESVFTSDEDRESFLDFFNKIQKTYWAFNRFATYIKKSKYVLNVNHDMFLTPISSKQRNVFCYYENKYIYLFTLQDLSRIIISAICHSTHFYPEPLLPKNPYSGLTFSTSDLYNIYFKMKESLLNVPTVIHQYFLSNFDIKSFKNKNEVIIRNIYINQFIQNEDPDEVVEYIYDMLSPYKQLQIDIDFPNSILIDTFKHILIYYLRYKYSHDNSRRQYNYLCVRSRILEIIKNTPGFGRKIISFANGKKYISFINIGGKHTVKTPWVQSEITILNNNTNIDDENENENDTNTDIDNESIPHNLPIYSQIRTRIDEIVDSIENSQPDNHNTPSVFENESNMGSNTNRNNDNFIVDPQIIMRINEIIDSVRNNTPATNYTITVESDNEYGVDYNTEFDSDDELEFDEDMYDP